MTPEPQPLPSSGIEVAVPARRAGRGVRLCIVVFTMFLLCLLWGALAVQLRHDRRQTLDAARARSAVLSATFAEHLTGLMRALDQTLLSLKRDYEHDAVGFDAAAELQRYPVLHDLSLQLSVIGSDGFLIASSSEHSAPRTYLGDREHFVAHLQADTGAMYISKPVLGRISNKWSIQLTRRLDTADGAFAGVVVLSLDPDYLSAFFNTLDVGPSGFVAIVGRDDMIVRARTAGKDLSERPSVASSQLPEHLRQAPVGTYEGVSSFRGLERLISYHALPEYPLVLVVGMPRRDILAHFEERRFPLILVAIAISAVFLAAAALLVRQIDRQARTEAELRRQAVELADSRHDAETASRAKSQFLANMSHELRTPLNAIIGFSDVMTKGLFGPIGSPRYRQYADDIYRSGQHLLELINGVLDMSRIEAGQHAISPEDVELAPLAQECLAYVSVRAEEGGLALESRMGSAPLAVRVDRRALRQILLNLLSNAVKFTAPGGRVSIAAEPERGGTIAIAVADTGVGIPAIDLERIFEPFQQADSTVARRPEGTGLGLAITKSLVGLNGGTVAIASTVGKGTTVTVRLPQASIAEFRAAV